MNRQEAYHRRAWRLATLLTGDRAQAERVVRACLRAQKRLDRLPPARLDRLVIITARHVGDVPAGRAIPDRVMLALARLRREHRAARGVVAENISTPQPPCERATLFSAEGLRMMGALLALPTQRREAWILRELDEIEPIEASRAMDCSRQAMERHLAFARATIGEALSDETPALLEALRRDADALEPGRFFFTPGRRTRGMRRLRRWAWWIALTALSAAIVIVWLSLA